MNPQSVSYSSQPQNSRKKIIRLAVIALIAIGVLVGIMALITLLVKPGPPEKLTDATSVSFAALTAPSGFTKSTNKVATIVNKDQSNCSVGYGILASTAYTGNDIDAYLQQITSELRSGNRDVSDGIEVQSLALPAANGKVTYRIPTRQITYIDGNIASTANYSIQKLKSKKFLFIAQTCSSVGADEDPSSQLDDLQPIIKLLKLEATVEKS